MRVRLKSIDVRGGLGGCKREWKMGLYQHIWRYRRDLAVSFQRRNGAVYSSVCRASDGRTECIDAFKNSYAMFFPLYGKIDCSGHTVLEDDTAFLLDFSDYDNNLGLIPAYIPAEVDGKPGNV